MVLFYQIVIKGINIAYVIFLFVNPVFCLTFRGLFHPPLQFIIDSKFVEFQVEQKAESISYYSPPGGDIERDVLRLLVIPDEFKSIIHFVFFLLCILNECHKLFELFTGR